MTEAEIVEAQRRAREDGRAAAILGQPIEANPFAQGQMGHTMWRVGYMTASDWTVGADGAAHTAPLFGQLAEYVERLIRGQASDLINGRVHVVAGLIVAQLAHLYNMRPAQWRPGDPPPEKMEIER